MRSPASFGTSASGQAPGPCTPAEVNRRDAFGRSVLHHLASADETMAGEYLQQLLSHPSVNVNLQDHESGWTALHRAMYYGNLRTAIILLQRADTDPLLRDAEGLTPFDLYNLTVDGTSPTPDDAAHGAELFVWGANRNYNLGLEHCNDCVLPERVKLARTEAGTTPGARFNRLRVRDVAMSKWHTVVLTTERRSNVYVTGIGTLGRLGRTSQTQMKLERLRDFSEPAVCVAVGADHTLLVASNGAVYTFGSNRMAQLGYTIEEGLGTVASSTGTVRSGASHASLHGVSIGQNGTELDIQVTPRRVLGSLKRETVLGAAASRLHSVVFTADAVYTWGTNTGQLGYDHHAAPVQVQPRKVTAISQPVRQVAATEFATACLLESSDVVVFHGDTHFRITFPVPRLSSDMSVFRPRQSQPKPTIHKLTCSGTTFAALSGDGDLFTFVLEHPTGLRGSHTPKVTPPRPQLVWSVRRKFSAVRDVAIGQDGALILCTATGHVYLRGARAESGTSKAQAARAAKFHVVPYLQRVVRVKMNETGSYAALQAPPRLKEIAVRGRNIESEMLALLPHVAPSDAHRTRPRSGSASSASSHSSRPSTPLTDASDDDQDGDQALQRYAAHARTLLHNAVEWRAKLRFPFDALPEVFAETGCDAVLVVEHGTLYVPAHRLVLATRIPALRAAIWAKERTQPPAALGVRVSHDGPLCVIERPDLSLISALFLLQYLYTDDLPPVWTANLGVLVGPLCRSLDTTYAPVLPELRMLASSFGLDALNRALLSSVPRAPEPALRGALEQLYACVAAHDARGCACEQAPPDVVLHLADRDVACHSFFLRRSPMLQALLEWHRTRGDQGTTHVDTPHWHWDVVRIGLQYLYTDAGLAIFAGSDTERTPDQFMDLVLDVLQFADELLLDKLQALCLTLLRQRIKPTNVGALLADANRHNATAFSEVCMDYATRNLETLLESGFLNGLAISDSLRLESYIQQRQDQHLNRTVASDRLFALSLKHQAYIAELDLPKPSLNMACLKVPKRQKSPALVPVDRTKSPELPPTPQNDDSLLFAMDDVQETLPKNDEWHTVGKQSKGRHSTAQMPRRSPALDAVQGEPSVSRWSLDSTPRSGGWHMPETPPVPSPRTGPMGPSDVLHGTPPPSATVSVESQEALARLPLAARVSQKERKKQQRTAPEPAPAPAAAPAWGRVARPSPNPSLGRPSPSPSASVGRPSPSPSVGRPSPTPSAARPTPSTSRPTSSLSMTRPTPSPSNGIWRSSPSGASPVFGGASPNTFGSPPAMSFAQIQQQQRVEGMVQEAARQTPKNFAQIQHEETVAQERQRRERQEAEAFERWFEEESRRVQQEQQSARQESSHRNDGRGRRGRRGGGQQRSSRGRGKQANPATARIDDA